MEAGLADLRLAEVIAALSLAIDLGLGQPMTHVLRTCVFAVRVGRAMGLDDAELADTYYTTLLRYVGCTADSHELRDFAAGEDIEFKTSRSRSQLRNAAPFRPTRAALADC